MPEKWQEKNKMPGFDRTGPMGRGSLTGRGLGLCGNGLAFGRGFGRGRGFRWKYQYLSNEPVNLTKNEEKKVLEAELKEIELEKQEIEKRLKAME